MFQKLVNKMIYGPFLASIYFLFVKDVKGLENLPKRSCIVAANHASYLDILCLSISIYKNTGRIVKYLAKKELFANPMLRYAISGSGIPVDRSKKNESAFREAIRYLKNKGIIGIYPEGTRTLTGKLQKGKTGVARLALWAKVPVVPIGIKGTFNLMPKGRIIPQFKKNVSIIIGKPIYFNQYYGGKISKRLLRKLTGAVMDAIAALLS